MSQESVEVVRDAFADWNRRDWEAWKAKHHDDMVAIPDRDWPEFEPLQGCEAWFRQVQVMLEAWNEQRLEMDDVHTTGDVAVVFFRWVARGRKTQIDVEFPFVGNYTVTDGKIKRIEVFTDPSRAFEAVGLRGESVPPGNVEVVRRVNDAWQRDDLEAFLDLVDPEVEWQAAVEGGVEGATSVYRGHEGMREFWALWRTEAEDFRFESQQLRDVGHDRVLHLGHMRWRGTASRVQVDSPLALVVTVHGGKIVRSVDYLSHEEALEAVGLRE